MDMITKTAKENKLKAERLSKIWEKDMYIFNKKEYPRDSHPIWDKKNTENLRRQ